MLLTGKFAKYIIIFMMLHFGTGLAPKQEPVEQPVQEIIEETIIEEVIEPELSPEEYILTLEQGTAGVLYIPNLNIEVPLNQATYINCQYYVDLPNSAAYYDYGELKDMEWYPYYDESTIIADHNNQAFSNLHNASNGDIAYIAKGNNIIKYEYDYTSIGHVVYDGSVGYMVDNNGNSLYKGYTNGITLQTCIDNTYRYMIRFRQI